MFQPHAVPDAYRRRCGSTSSTDKTRIAAPPAGDNHQPSDTKTTVRGKKEGKGSGPRRNRERARRKSTGRQREEEEEEGEVSSCESEENLPLSKVKEMKVGC